MSISDFKADECPEEITQRLQNIPDNGYDRFETRQKRADGTLIDVEVSLARIPESGRMITLIRDIS